MKSFLRSLIVATVLSSIAIHAQNEQKYSGLFSYQNNRQSGKHLKDSVKKVYLKLNERQNLSRHDKERVILSNDIRHSPYLEFDQYGRIKAIIGTIPEKEYFTAIDYKRAEEYIYEDKDWFEKSKYKIALKQYYPVSNYNLLLKLNSVAVEKEVTIVKDKIWQSYDEDIYIYIYDKQGRVAEEQKYIVYRFGETIKDKTAQKDDLKTRKIFSYDEKGQVVNLKIIAGPWGEKMAYTDMGTECDFCEDLQMKYAYDSLGRITQVTMYGCGAIVAKEEYSYHPTKDYVETVKYYVTGPGEMSNPTKNFVKTFNENGDLIMKEFIPNYPEQDIPVIEYYYSYEYDSHDNWIKCNIYMEGTKEGEPSAIAERKIEYYN